MTIIRKYKNVKVSIDGYRFDSKKEAQRYGILKIDPEVTELKLQVKFPIHVNSKLICNYVSDFTYLRNGEYIVEDVKGMKTSMYRLKKKLMKAVHNIEIFET